MRLLNNRGFSLASVLVAAGMVGGLAIAVMQLTKNVSDSGRMAESQAGAMELRTSIRMILDNRNYCRISLAGEGPAGSPTTPITFAKSDIDEETEGLDIALYLSDQVGTSRTLKKYNGENNPDTEDKSAVGKLKIKSIKLIMNNGTGSDYTDSPSHTDMGIIRVLLEKKLSNSQMRTTTHDFAVNLNLATGQSPEASGETRIISCSSDPAAAGDHSLVENGYTELPSGIIFQWGRLTGVALDQTYHSITFPKAFPTTIFNVNTSIRRATAISGTVSAVSRNPTLTGVEVAGDHDTDVSTGDIYWFAVGN